MAWTHNLLLPDVRASELSIPGVQFHDIYNFWCLMDLVLTTERADFAEGSGKYKLSFRELNCVYI